MLVDANLLIYSHDASSVHHEKARTWFEDGLNSPRRIGIPWPSIVAFLRLTTNPRVSAQPFTPAEAWEHVESWFRSPSAWIPQPTTRHREVFRSLVVDLQLTANLISDAHLAALAMEHGLELFSADSDFARFPAVRWRNPLATR
jgi:toxin-antitoxin system PIN domain toxin